MQSFHDRVVVWFSCGAASAVAARLAVDKYKERCVVVYCDTSADEHPDNLRFFRDVETWIGIPILKIRSKKYSSITDVFERRRFMSSLSGAICTAELKIVPRNEWQRPDDIHVWGYTADEVSRIEKFENKFPELSFDWILRDKGIYKRRALKILEDEKIKLPEMYNLGFDHNNCIGCVKATSPDYWRKIRRLFPSQFAERSRVSREINCRLVRINGERKFLDELPADDDLALWSQIDCIHEQIECGPICQSSGEM